MSTREHLSKRATRRLAQISFAIMACAWLEACGKIVGIDGLAIGECKGGVCGEEEDSGGDRPDTAQPPIDAPMDVITNPDGGACPGKEGPVGVRVGGGENTFCIDSTEVTVGMYKAFLDAPDASRTPLPPECAWKTNYQPVAAGGETIPQTGVDWCDAWAYCAWAGKKLCGKVVNGAAQGNLSTAELPDFNVNSWLIACSAQGQLTYPYGSIRRTAVCNLADYDAGQRAIPTKEAKECVGGYPGVYDMLGNVWEWIDACRPRDAGADAADGGYQKMECIAKGGSFAISPANMTCRTDGTGATRDLRATDIGFRCCAY